MKSSLKAPTFAIAAAAGLAANTIAAAAALL